MSAQGHIRKRGEAWEIRYELPRLGGKRRTKTVSFRGSYRDAQRELRKLLDLAEQGVAPEKGSLASWLDRWLAMVKAETSPTTHEHYKRNVDSYIRPRLGGIPLAKLSRLDVQQTFSELAVGGRADGKPGALAPSTQKQIYLTLTIALARAVDLQLIGTNPANVMRRRMPKIEQPETAILAPEQSTRLLDASRSTSLFAPILLALATGCRRGEASALTWASVDLDRGAVTVSRAAKQVGADITIGATKNRKSRVVTIGANAILELRAWKRKQAEQLLRLGVRQTAATRVCTRASGEPVGPNSITIDFWRLAKRLDLNVHYHSLRHGHATAMLVAGVHPKVAQERLGHHSVAFTLDRYSHTIEQLHDDAAAKLDALFGSG